MDHDFSLMPLNNCSPADEASLDRGRRSDAVKRNHCVTALGGHERVFIEAQGPFKTGCCRSDSAVERQLPPEPVIRRPCRRPAAVPRNQPVIGGRAHDTSVVRRATGQRQLPAAANGDSRPRADLRCAKLGARNLTFVPPAGGGLVATHCSRWRFFQRATGLLRNLTFAHAA